MKILTILLFLSFSQLSLAAGAPNDGLLGTVDNQTLDIRGDYQLAPRKLTASEKMRKMRNRLEKQNELMVRKQIERMRYQQELNMMKKIKQIFDNKLQKIENI
jgi:hypothetical protein